MTTLFHLAVIIIAVALVPLALVVGAAVVVVGLPVLGALLLAPLGTPLLVIALVTFGIAGTLAAWTTRRLHAEDRPEGPA